MSIKTAKTRYSVIDPVKERWSPRSFSETPVETEKLQSLFEAARWSSSAMNEQPWRFIIGLKGDPTWDKLFDCLVEWNQKWAVHAPVLLMAVGKNSYTESGKKNEYAVYDTGQAMAQLSIQAVSLGVYVHQMAGFSVEKAISIFSIPEGNTPLTLVAIGYPGDPEILQEPYKSRETEARERNDFSEFVFSGSFNNPSQLFS
jgi:nitroreductase